jgi:hypothetical protein
MCGVACVAFAVGGCKTARETEPVEPAAPVERSPEATSEDAGGWAADIGAAGAEAGSRRDDDMPTPTQVKLMRDREPFVFIAKPMRVEGAETFLAQASRPRTPQPMRPGRAAGAGRGSVQLEIVSIVRGPAYEQGATWQRHLGDPPADRFPDVTEPLDVSIDMELVVGLGDQAAVTPEQRRPFADLDAALARSYVVMLGLPMYVDRGNHPSPAPAAWVDVAGDPKLPNKGFDTFEEALAYARRLAAM